MEETHPGCSRGGRRYGRGKRIITPARKEQNRLAQRAYRKRLRDRKESSQHASLPAHRASLRRLKPLQPTIPAESGSPSGLLSKTSGGYSCQDLVCGPPDSTSTTGSLWFPALVDEGFQLQAEAAHPAPEGLTLSLLGEFQPTMDQESLEWEPLPPLPDLLANTLEISRATTYTAYFNNARTLYLDIPDCLQPTCMSPFYRQVSPRDDPKLLLASVSDPSIPIHLQPTLPQVIYPHHPWMDLIPFPTLRARLIVMTTTMPHVFDLGEFKRDLYLHEALICWRTRANGQPWDMRSWEVAPWFLRKWKMLVDGESGDIWKQSKWWQSARSRVSEIA